MIGVSLIGRVICRRLGQSTIDHICRASLSLPPQYQVCLLMLSLEMLSGMYGKILGTGISRFRTLLVKPSFLYYSLYMELLLGLP